MSCAAFEDLLLKGFVQPDATGHFLGEFSTLASVPDILPNSYLIDVDYLGLTIQPVVECDEQSRSHYAMCAVNPSRVSKTFNDAALRIESQKSLHIEDDYKPSPTPAPRSRQTDETRKLPAFPIPAPLPTLPSESRADQRASSSTVDKSANRRKISTASMMC